MDVSVETLQRIADMDRQDAEEAAALTETVKRKPTKTTSKSSLKAQTSATSLKKSSRSKSNLMNSSELNTIQEGEKKGKYYEKYNFQNELMSQGVGSMKS